MKKLGIYIHIPFCRQRCLYCGFHSNATGEGAGGRQAMAAYVQWLIGQIMEKGKQYRKQYTVDTVFIGGGTPSMLSAAAVEAILGAVRESFVLESEAEITIEANPDSLDAGKLKRYLGAGINRLSMGVQSFDDGLLQTLGRVHDAAEAETKFRLVRRVGFRNIKYAIRVSLCFVIYLLSGRQDILCTGTKLSEIWFGVRRWGIGRRSPQQAVKRSVRQSRRAL